MTPKQLLKVSGAVLFLYGIFGYLFPDWGKTVFSNNENLTHVIKGILLVIAVELPRSWQKWIVALIALGFLSVGIYGFAHIPPSDIHIKHLFIQAHLDTFDNYANIVLGLFFAWIFLQYRTTSKSA